MGLIGYFGALAAGPLAAIVYWLGYSWRGPSDAKTLWKAAATGILFVWLWVFSSELEGRAIAWAVLLAWIGDVALSRPGDRAFALGVVAFGGAHVALIWLFVEIGIAPWRNLPTLALVAAMAAGALVLLPRRAGGTGPILALYILAIAAMAAMASQVAAPDPRVTEAVWLAAALFVASDALIGVERYLLPPGSRLRVPIALTIWPCYWIALVLFAAAAVAPGQSLR
ncbi:MAG: lysoplasmalogenase family protein [Shimia sp.]